MYKIPQITYAHDRPSSGAISRINIGTDGKKNFNTGTNHTLTAAGSFVGVVNLCRMGRSSGKVGRNDELAKYNETHLCEVKVTRSTY
jgi:hypothetical protein